MPSDKKRVPHPSGRPIKRDDFRRLPVLRVPSDGPLLPSLRRRELASAIGFRIDRIQDEDDE